MGIVSSVVLFFVLFFLLFFALVLQFHTWGESNGVDMVSHMEHGCSGFLYRFEGVFQSFFKFETIGHDHDGAFHSAPVLQ